MEELLNKLIEKGWKPYGTLGNVKKGVYTNKYLFFEGCADGITLRQLVSKESGLWQFVCENGMVELTEYYGVCNWMFGENKYYDETETEKFYTHRDYEYRLIESALKDESELEKFLLDNIKM